jgi:hypothetical protein
LRNDRLEEAAQTAPYQEGDFMGAFERNPGNGGSATNMEIAQCFPSGKRQVAITAAVTNKYG